MLFNYFRIAFRNIIRQKGYSAINLLGLTTGMAATMLIMLYVNYEFSFDKYHDNSERIYRVSRQWLNDDGTSNLHLGHLAPPFAPLIENDFEGVVVEAVRFLDGSSPLIVAGDRSLQEDGFFFADEDAFNVFSWDFVLGDPSTSLAEPNSIVLTERAADKYFGRTDAIGEQVVYKNFGLEIEMEVTGIIKNIPTNSHFTFDMLGSMLTIENIFGRENMMQDWGSNNYSTYLLFRDKQDADLFVAGVPEFIDRHLDGRDTEKASVSNKLHVMPLTDIHLKSSLDSEIGNNGSMAIVSIFLIIALLILVIACINFMNLSTARSNKRSREVGMRKVLGAARNSLIGQFIIESIIFALISFGLAFVIVYISLPLFNDFINKPLTLDIFSNPFVLTLSGGIILFTGILAGSYPAFYLSSFRPASILKGGHKNIKSSFNMRSVLVVFQFCISAGLITAVGIVQDQLDFVKSKDLGFNKEEVMVLPSPADIFGKFESIKQRLEEHSGILQVSLGSRVPSGRLLDSQGASTEIDGEVKRINFRIADVHVSHEYLEQLGVPLASGRHFDPEIASDSSEAFIINMATVTAIGWESADEAVGQPFNYGNRSGRIIGVTEEFHFESLHQQIAPIIFMVTSGRINSVLVKLRGDQAVEVEEFLRNEWSFLRPGFPFTSYYLNENFDEQYAEEDALFTVVSFFSGLAVIIAALGLLGLASFITEQRIKEIGIRKVMGASVSSILYLLSRNFTILVIIGYALSIPLTIYFMNYWLEGFAYSTSIGVWPLLTAGLITLFIAWFTVSFRTIRAAQSDPVESLRYE